MPMKKRHAAALAAIASGSLAATCASAQVTNSSAYNSPWGMSQASENQTVNPSLRDANGNLTVVNGQFTSSAMGQQSGAQNMGSLGQGGSGVGFAGPTSSQMATAIGNQLNVVTVGSDNTVIVNAQQINNGSQTANVK